VIQRRLARKRSSDIHTGIHPRQESRQGPAGYYGGSLAGESGDSRSGARHTSATGSLLVCLIKDQYYGGSCSGESGDSRSGARHTSATGSLLVCLIKDQYYGGSCSGESGDSRSGARHTSATGSLLVCLIKDQCRRMPSPRPEHRGSGG
jgi:hypothetical protein